MPFWAFSVFFCWVGFSSFKTIDWLLFGIFAALGIFSHYFFVYLLVAMDVFFVYFIVQGPIYYSCFFSLFAFILVLFPHTIWLVPDDYVALRCALHSTGFEDKNILDRFVHPFPFLGGPIGVLIPFFVVVLFVVSKFKPKFTFKDKKLLFLLTINIFPILLMFLTSFLMGVKIRTMWMAPFSLFFGVFIVYIFPSPLPFHTIKYFVSVFFLFFILSPKNLHIFQLPGGIPQQRTQEKKLHKK
jgi:hypothetical protein